MSTTPQLDWSLFPIHVLPRDIFLLILSFVDYFHMAIIASRVNRHWHRCCWESRAYYGFGLWHLDPASVGTIQHPGIWRQLRPEFVRTIRRLSLRFQLSTPHMGPNFRISFEGILRGPVTAMPVEWANPQTIWTKLEHLHVKSAGIYRDPKHAACSCVRVSIAPELRTMPVFIAGQIAGRLQHFYAGAYSKNR